MYHKTGLGDVISCFFGGIEIRTKPGIPPWGVIEHIIGNNDLVLCVIDKSMDTKEILDDIKNIELIKMKRSIFALNQNFELIFIS